jgi:hypothetical protein
VVERDVGDRSPQVAFMYQLGSFEGPGNGRIRPNQAKSNLLMVESINCLYNFHLVI